MPKTAQSHCEPGIEATFWVEEVEAIESKSVEVDPIEALGLDVKLLLTIEIRAILMIRAFHCHHNLNRLGTSPLRAELGPPRTALAAYAGIFH
jgi:hypothetical protein